MNNEITLPPGILDPERVAAIFAANGVVVLPEFFTISEMAEPSRIADYGNCA